MQTSSSTSSTQGVYSSNGRRPYDSSRGEEPPRITIPKPPPPLHTRDSIHSSVRGATSSRQKNLWDKVHSPLATNEKISRPVAQEEKHFHSRPARRRPGHPKRRPAKRRHGPVNQNTVDRGSDDETKSLENTGGSDSDESPPDGTRLDSPEPSGNASFGKGTRSSDNAEPTGRDTASDNAHANFDEAGRQPGASAYEASSENSSRPQEKSSPMNGYCDSLCWICRRPFQISSVKRDNWKCFYQPIATGRDGDLPPAQRCVSGVKPAIHDCCWEVACQVLECSSLALTRRVDVIRHIQYLSAFTEKTPFDTETNALDLELFTDSDCTSTSSCEEESPQQLLLESMLSRVVRLLQQQDSIILIDDLKKVDPCLAQWMILAHSYSVQMNRTLNVRPLLERVVRNLRESDASRFPKAYNFRVAWHNVQQAIGALETLPRPEMILLDPQFKGQGRYLRHRIAIDKFRRFSFFFYPCNVFRQYRLTGVVCDGFSIGSCPLGYPYTRVIHLPVGPLRGLHIAQTSTGQVTALKFKNADGWSLSWYGELAHACDVVQIELNESNQDVVFHFDTLQMEIKKIIPIPRLH